MPALRPTWAITVSNRPAWTIASTVRRAVDCSDSTGDPNVDSTSGRGGDPAGSRSA